MSTCLLQVPTVKHRLARAVSSRLRVNLLAVAVTAALATFSVVHVGSAACSSDPYRGDVVAESDVEALRGAMGCDGNGTFEVTWHSVSILERIEVSDGKNLTVTGRFDAEAEINARGTDGIFFVYNRSTLTLNQLVLSGGNATGAGGAIAIDSSTVNVDGCSFVGNSASISGDNAYILQQDRP